MLQGLPPDYERVDITIYKSYISMSDMSEYTCKCQDDMYVYAKKLG